MHEDGLRINATAFKIEQLPPIFMASCSSENQAMEIDFEADAGQEMIDYIVARSAVRKGRGRFLLEYDGKRFNCTVTTDGSRRPAWVRVSWKPDTKAIAEPREMIHGGIR